MPRASSRSSASACVSSSWRRADHLGRQLGMLGDLVLRDPQRQRERDEPLLGAVVEVALEPAALLQARLDDPRAGTAQRRLQPLSRSFIARPAAAATCASASGSRLASWMIAPTSPPSSSTGVYAWSSPVRAAPVAPHPAVLDPVQELERRVAQRVREQRRAARRCRSAPSRCSSSADRVRLRERAAQEADQERERDGREDELATRRGRMPGDLVRRRRSACVSVTATQHHQRHARTTAAAPARGAAGRSRRASARRAPRAHSPTSATAATVMTDVARCLPTVVVAR